MGTGDTRSLWLLITWNSWSSVPSYCGINTLFSDLSFLSKQGFLFPVHFLSSLWAGPGRHLWFCFPSPDQHPVRSPFQTDILCYPSLGQCGIEYCPHWYNDLLTSSSPFTSSQRGLLKKWWLFWIPFSEAPGLPPNVFRTRCEFWADGAGASLLTSEIGLTLRQGRSFIWQAPEPGTQPLLSQLYLWCLSPPESLW